MLEQGFLLKGEPACPSPCLWARLGSRRSGAPSGDPQPRRKDYGGRKTDRSILPAFETKSSPASKKSILCVSKFLISKQCCGFHRALPPYSYKRPRRRRRPLLLGHEATVALPTEKTQLMLMDGISSHPTGSLLFPLSVNAAPFALYEL